MDGVLNATGILPALVMQPITKAVISYFSKNGGNALGIAEDDGPLICKTDLPYRDLLHSSTHPPSFSFH